MRKFTKRLISGIIAVAMSVSAMSNIILVPGWATTIQREDGYDYTAQSGPSIYWSFENGIIAPFTVADGEFGVGIIANWVTDQTAPYGKVNKEGNYYLSTCDTDTTANFNGDYVGTIISPTFRLKDPTVKMKIGGGVDPECYVAIVREAGAVELARYSLSTLSSYEYDGDGDGINDSVATSPFMFTDVELTVPDDLFVEDQVVYIKIVDRATGDDGFILVDDIRASGETVKTTSSEEKTYEYKNVTWDFEDGTIAPFTITAGSSFNQKMLADIDYDWNTIVGKSVLGYEIGKHGTWFLNTYFNSYTQTVENGILVEKVMDGGNKYKGALRSPVFVLNPENTTITMQLGGNVATGVVVYDAVTGTAVGSAHPSQSSWVMSECTVVWKDDFEYTEGRTLYLQIEDTLTSGSFPFVTIDYIRFSGSDGRYQNVAWDFEDGTTAPFTATSGSNLNSKLIADLDYDWNTVVNKPVSGKLIGKNGDWFLNTYFDSYTQTVVDGILTEKTATGSEKYLGSLRSPNFILDPSYVSITMQLGGNVANCVAVYDAATDKMVGIANAAQNSWVMTTVSVVWNDDFSYTEGQELYLQIEDKTVSGGFCFLTVDNICFRGEVLSKYEYVSWDFEDGTIAPFTVTAGSNLNKQLLCDIDYDWNVNVNKSVSGKNIGKSGDWFLNTYFDSYTQTVANGIVTEKKSAGKENYVGSLRSPIFVLDPSNTSITMQLGGNTANVIGVYDAATDTLVGSASCAKNGWIMSTVSVQWVEGFVYTEGQMLYIKIEDNLTSGGFCFLTLDNICFSGSVVSRDYYDVIWSFENGTILPFESGSTLPDGTVASYINGGMVPHGEKYLNTLLTSPTSAEFDYSRQFELVSPKFMLDPSNPIITLSLLGGGEGSGSYVAVYNAATNGEIARVYANNSWEPVTRTIDLTGKFAEGELLIMRIVDGEGSQWNWIGVDNIRASINFAEEPILSTLELVMTATGWNREAFDTLTAMVEGFIKEYGDKYPSGQTYLDRIFDMQVAQSKLATLGVTVLSEECRSWIREMDELAYKIYVSNPALGSGLIAFTVHEQYTVDHQNTHNMFPSYNGEVSDKSKYVGGSALKVLDLKTGNVYTLLEDTDGLYRDLDVSYNSDKILLSYREDRDSTYNIVEYTLSDDRTRIVSTRQLTSLSTADDMDPMYLPSGDIVFSSTRDPKYVMCNRHIAANLYRMESDGANIVKITSSTLFERPTDVLPDGRILYDRWEYNDRDFGSAQGLWTVYEDGTKQDTYYGNNSPTGATIEGKSIPGTQMVMAILSSCHDLSWGALAIVDRSKGVDGNDPIVMTWPEYAKNMVGNPNTSKNNIDAFKDLSTKYEDPQPLNENYFLVSRTLPGSSKMGLYLLDTYGNEILLYEDKSSMGVFDATLLTVRETEIDTSDRRNYNDGTGTFFIQDVYLGTHMEGVERGTVKTLRIVESVDKKYNTYNSEWNGEGAQYPAVNFHSFEVKRVIGEVPVYEDGSAYFEVPSDVFVYFQLLDADGKMIQSMRSGTLIQSGEQTGCVGCHEDRRTAPVTTNNRNTPMALEASIRVIPNPDYVEGSNLPKTIMVNQPDVPQKRVFDPETKTDILVAYNDPAYFDEYLDLPTMNYLTEVQPIFTNNCLSCHGYDDPAANLSLVPDRDIVFNASYLNLWVDRNKSGVFHENLVGAIGAGDSGFYNAKSWGSYNSPLVEKLYNDETHRELLTDAERRKIVEWVDLNGTYYGDYSTNYGYNAGGRSPLTAEERTAIGDTREMRFSAYQLSSFGMAIYFDNPEKSPILKGKTGAEYDAALAIIEAGLERLRINPDVDWRDMTTVPGNKALSINPFHLNALDQWRLEKVALYDAMEAANRAAIKNGTKLYDKDHEAVMAEHNTKFPGWPKVNKTGHYYERLLG